MLRTAGMQPSHSYSEAFMSVNILVLHLSPTPTTRVEEISRLQSSYFFSSLTMLQKWQKCRTTSCKPYHGCAILAPVSCAVNPHRESVIVQTRRSNTFSSIERQRCIHTTCIRSQHLRSEGLLHLSQKLPRTSCGRPRR